MGQIGIQFVLPAQTLRPWYGCELRPAGVGLTKTDFPSIVIPWTPAAMPSSTSDGGIDCIGNEYPGGNVSPMASFSGACSSTDAATPISLSAAPYSGCRSS